MISRRTILAACLLTFALFGLLPCSTFAAPSKVCESKLDVKVAAADTAWLTCDGGLRGLEAYGELYDVSGRHPVLATRHFRLDFSAVQDHN